MMTTTQDYIIPITLVFAFYFIFVDLMLFQADFLSLWDISDSFLLLSEVFRSFIFSFPSAVHTFAPAKGNRVGE
jgi:hypothetical protein